MKENRIKEITSRFEKEKIHFDCRHYTGYKPCGLSEFCEGCAQYKSRGIRILVIKLAALGDVLRTTPILTGIKKVYPESRITWITDTAAIPLLKGNPLIDELRIMDAEGILIVSQSSFDLALNFEKEARALALFKAVHAKEKRGFSFSDAGSLGIANKASLYSLQLGLHDELKYRLNEETYQQTIFKMAEIPYSGEDYILEITSAAKEFADNFAKTMKSQNQIRIGINTGCGGVFETKRWTEQGFIDLCRMLSRDGDCDLLLLGGTREREFNKSIMEKCGDILTDTGCDNSLEMFLGVVSLCDVVVSSDSLAAHIALALKKQAVIFFGPTCPQEVDVFGRGEKIITNFPCAPCYLKMCSNLPRCMDKLDAGRVYEAVRRRIEFLRTHRSQ